MRISVDKTDPDYNRLFFGSTVRCNGKVVKKVITADEENGYVLAFEVDEKGGYVFGGDLSLHRYPKKIEIFGKVKIELSAKHK